MRKIYDNIEVSFLGRLGQKFFLPSLFRGIEQKALLVVVISAQSKNGE